MAGYEKVVFLANTNATKIVGNRIHDMESVGHVVVPLRVGGKKMKKRRELDALVAHSLAKR